MRFPLRPLPPPTPRTGRERRFIHPFRGPFKRAEAEVDYIAERYVYPHVWGIWNPYSWLLPRRLSVAEATIESPLWPADIHELRVLFVSDVHTGVFLRPELLGDVFAELMKLEPDLVAIGGDIVEARPSDLDPFLDAFRTLTRAPLGAWYCHGNHDHYERRAHEIRRRLDGIGIPTLLNATEALPFRGTALRIGGVDDRVLGDPDWSALGEGDERPHLLLAHNPDDFYEAAGRRIPVVLSGHTHGGQIRLPNRGPIIRQSEFRLDEGLYRHRDTILAVSRGLGAVGIPWRAGAGPEAMWLTLRPPVL